VRAAGDHRARRAEPPDRRRVGLRALALSAETFREFPVDPPIQGFDLEEFEGHSARVANLARAICVQTAQRDEAFAAGLFHDVGLLVIASQERDELAATIAAARLERRPVHEIERERHGVTHADVGAHLLALWGLPHDVTEAVAQHHVAPMQGAPFDTVAATYVANLLIGEIESLGREDAPAPVQLDYDYLETIGLADQVPRWRELAERQFEGPR
jgi:putative nucleotidyltransferase with HDIG domain